MLRWIDFEGDLVPLEQVETHEELLKRFPLAYLREITSIRPWKGVPSVTQCMKGTMEAFLQLATPYSEKPDDAAWRITGVKGHGVLENAGDPENSEIRITHNNISGMFDAITVLPSGKILLWDYKFWGAYAINKALGRDFRRVRAVDEDGCPIVYKKKTGVHLPGDQKTVREYFVNADKADRKDITMQLNMYRILARDHGYDMKPGKDLMQVFVTNREGGLASAKEEGLDQKTYVIPIDFLDDIKVVEYFGVRSKSLVDCVKRFEENGGVIDPFSETYNENALKKTLPRFCTSEEAWRGAKCAKYCAVAETCKKLGCPYV